MLKWLFVLALIPTAALADAAVESPAPAEGEVGQEAVSPQDAPTYQVLMDLFGDLQMVTYSKIGPDAVIGGDTVLGTHSEVQRQSIAKLLNLLASSDDSVLQREDLRALIAEARTLLENSPDVRGAVQESTKVWPSNRIPFVIMASIGDAATRQRIERALGQWSASTGIQFVPAGPGDRQVLRFEDAAGDGWVCHSRLGMGASGTVVSLNPECPMGAVLHEIGHALGLMHEHSRADRNQFLALSPTAQLDPSNYGTFAMRHRTAAYDPCSLMHYSPKQAPSGQTPWYSLTQEGKALYASCAAQMPAGCRELGQRCSLSPADQRLIRAIYPD